MNGFTTAQKYEILRKFGGGKQNPNRRAGGKAAQRSGANFQKVVAISARTSGLLTLTELPPNGGRFVSATKFIRQEIPTDFIGVVNRAGRAIFFDAKCLGDDYASFPINNAKVLASHQKAFLRAADDAGAIAGLLVECKRLGRYLWLRGCDLVGPDTVPWTDPRWIELGPTISLVDFTKLLAAYGLWKVATV